MSAALRFLARGLRLLPHLAVGMGLALAIKLDFRGWLQPEPLTQWWNARLLRILGLRLTLRGAPVAGGHVTVANHVSWLDIPLLAACERTRFVSKAEVRNWPVAGWLANAAGTFYLARGKHGTRPLLNRLVPFLRRGGTVAIFPEGTTTAGEGVLAFHARLFAAAIEAERPLQPVALRYGRTPAGDNIAAYVGDDVLLFHILRLLRSPGLSAEVVFLPPISAAGRERAELAQATRAAIEAALQPSPDLQPAPGGLGLIAA